MKLELNEHELDYLTMVIEQNLEDVNETEEDTQRLYFEMLEDLYSKLVVLNKLNIEEEEETEEETLHGARLREAGISNDYYENGDEFDEGDSSYDEHYN